MYFSFAVSLFLCVKASYKNRKSMSFSLVVVDGSSKITSMWAVSINSTVIREPILSNYFSPSNEQTEYHSLCCQPCLLLPPPCLLSHAMSTICPMKIRAWQLLRGNDKNVKVMREQQISSSLPSLLLLEEVVLKKGEEMRQVISTLP